MEKYGELLETGGGKERMTRYFTVGFCPQHSLQLSSLRIPQTRRQARGPLVVAVADGLGLLLPAAANCALRPVSNCNSVSTTVECLTLSQG